MRDVCTSLISVFGSSVLFFFFEFDTMIINITRRVNNNTNLPVNIDKLRVVDMDAVSKNIDIVIEETKSYTTLNTVGSENF